MKDTEFVAALRNLKATFKPMVCLDCQKGDNCTIKGCNLIGMAADTIEKYESAIESMEKMYFNAYGVGKYYLRDVLRLFRIYMPPTPDPRNHIAQKQSNVHLDISCSPIQTIPPLYPSMKRITDFERCADDEELAAILRCIDDRGYYLTGVTQDASGVYTVFFRRPAQE